MIFNVPAESGGALSILKEVYEEAVAFEDKTINWSFVVSKPDLKETDNVKVLSFPWVKKSWFHRLYFDNFIAPKLVRKNKATIILSLQNIIIPRVKVKQVLYVHQSLPFVEYKFSLKENKLLWIYQNIIGRKIIRSIKDADKVIVQTKWMKNASIEKTLVQNDKIEVISPKPNFIVDKYYKPTTKSTTLFFYPANAMDYKNHRVIVNACRQLKEKFNGEYEVLFTIKGNETQHVTALYNQVKEEGLPISFVGPMNRKEVFKLYTKSVLLFPSYIETFGLPLLEARMHKGIILAANAPFSREILDEYENVYYFDPFNHNELSELMKLMSERKLAYKFPKEKNRNTQEVEKPLQQKSILHYCSTQQINK